MQTSVSSAGVISPGVAQPGSFGQTTGKSFPDPRKFGAKSRKQFRRPYKPLPTTRYLVAGLAAILMSMGLITGAMSTVSEFDVRPWDSSQELRWNPFQKNDTLGLDPGALNQSGKRSGDAITQNTILDWLRRTNHRGVGNPSTRMPSPPAGNDNAKQENSSSPSPSLAPTPTGSTPDSPSPSATFEVPGAPQAPTASEPPTNGKPPVAMGKNRTAGSQGPTA